MLDFSYSSGSFCYVVRSKKCTGSSTTKKVRLKLANLIGKLFLPFKVSLNLASEFDG